VAGPWRICQRADHPDSTQANAQALIDLDGGADALALVTSDAPAARGAGLRLNSLADLDDALAGVQLDLIALRFDAGAAAPEAAALLSALVKQRRLDASQLAVDFGCDPVALHAADDDQGAFSLALASTARALKRQGFAGATHLADGRVWHDAGASEAQELGLVIASAVETLRLMEGQGIAPADTAQDISFCLSADADLYLGLSKFRALRQLWARVEASCGLAYGAIRIHAETSWRMMSQRDPHVNILRAGAAVFAAALGGADTITVLPFTAALGLPDAFARRLARNTQLVFLEEAHLAKVVDPGAGAGGFEALTQGLCEKAWAFFQSIEVAGGLLKALRSGAPQEAVAKTAEARAALIASGKQPLTGVTVFKLKEEILAQTLAVKLQTPVTTVMPARRDAEPYEAPPLQTPPAG
jgi:methylmalonyl-CoA mutase